MYFILAILHIAFIVLSHILGYFLLEWIFILLFLFFLLYFSPIFFVKESIKIPKISLPDITKTDSIVVPVLFFYVALYFFVYAITGSLEQSFSLHIIILIGIYGMIFAYMIGFDWKIPLFFHSTKIHIFLAWSTILLLLFFSIFSLQTMSVYMIILFVITLGFSYIFFQFSTDSYPILFLGIVFLSLFFPYTLFLFFTGGHDLTIAFLSLACMAVCIFEIFPRISFFREYEYQTRVFLLVVLMALLWISLFLSFSFQNLVFLIFFLTIFLFSIHIRYCNYSTFFLGIFSLFFLYSYIFYPLITTSSLFSTLLFVFFLPLCIIGNTYFWEEKNPDDIKILHTSSIAFSVIFSLYAIVFFPWWQMILFVLSACIFLVGFLFTVSYFRYHSH